MEPQLLTYFKGEKLEAALFIGIGVLAIGISVLIFLKSKDDFLSGLIYPLVLIALIQLTVGSTVYFRTDAQVEQLVLDMSSERDQIVGKELDRMSTVMTNFGIYKWIEVGVILTGVLLLVVIKEKSFWMGVGLGMLVQGTIMISLDLFAEKRGETYIEWLSSATSEQVGS